MILLLAICWINPPENHLIFLALKTFRASYYYGRFNWTKVVRTGLNFADPIFSASWGHLRLPSSAQNLRVWNVHQPRAYFFKAGGKIASHQYVKEYSVNTSPPYMLHYLFPDSFQRIPGPAGLTLPLSDGCTPLLSSNCLTLCPAAWAGFTSAHGGVPS